MSVCLSVYMYIYNYILVKNPWTGLKYVHVNFMFNLQHFAIYNVSSAILYGAIGIDLLVVRQDSYHMKTSQSIAANCLRRIACFS